MKTIHLDHEPTESHSNEWHDKSAPQIGLGWCVYDRGSVSIRGALEAGGIDAGGSGCWCQCPCAAYTFPLYLDSVVHYA